MSSYNARVPADQQFQLIMECRNSGLSDYQWCKEHGIHPGTFYNWVSRLRRKACCEIPESISKAEPSPAPVQEVVRLNFNSKQRILSRCFYASQRLRVQSKLQIVLPG